ncbi:MAG: ATP-binding cassette domain-containing protein [Candidatus Bathyarchaeia archaeon]
MIEVKGLSYVYQPMGVVALQDIDLTIKDCEFVAIIGQNGSGKTTLVKHFNGLLKPTKGQVLIDGVDTKNESISRLSRKVGYVFQNPDHQIFAESVREEIEFGPKNLGFSKEELQKIVEEVSKRVGLYEYLNDPPISLGKGQRQRLAVASILAMQPSILVIDEPTTGQDWKECIAIMDLLDELNKKGKTIIVVTHNMKLVSLYAKRTVVMLGGRILLDGPTDEVFTRIEDLEKAFIRPPSSYLLGMHFSKLLGLKELRMDVEGVSSAIIKRIKG